MAAPTTAPSTLLKVAAWLSRWCLGLALGAWLLFAAAWGALYWLIVPRIGELRPNLETVASELIGLPVRVEAIEAHTAGLIPSFALRNVRLLDRQGGEALKLERVLVSLSPRSLLALEFEQLHIEGPTVALRRAADGRIRIAGIELSGGPGVDSRLLNALFSQPEFVVRNGVLLWTDELHGLPTLELRDLDLVLRNSARRHDIRIDATPPAQWGERFALVGKFQQPLMEVQAARWREWSGQVYTHFPHIDLSQLGRYAGGAFELQRGHGALRAWVDIRRADLSAATADILLADVGVRLNPALQPLRLASVSGRLSGSFSPGSHHFSTQGLAFDTADGVHWPGGTISVTHHDADASRAEHGELVAERLDLAALTQIASQLPFGTRMRRALERHAPSGVLEHLRVSWQGPADTIGKYELRGRVSQLSLQARPAAVAAGAMPTPGLPGISGATLDFRMTESAGKASLAIRGGSLAFPGVFEEPEIPFASLDAELSWQLEADKLALQVSRLRFANADAAGELDLKWRTSDPSRSSSASRFPGVLDMQGRLSRAEANRVARYLPLLLRQPVRDYVREAVLAGNSSAVAFKLRGDLADMPFTNPKLGEFLVSIELRNAVFSYVPRARAPASSLIWPALTQLSGELIFDRRSLQLRGARAGVAGFPGLQIVKGEAGVADLRQSPVLVVGLDARGPLSEMLAFVNTSPVAEWSARALAQASASGAAELGLKLNLPLQALARSGVQGSLELAGNDIQIAPGVPQLARARGTVVFSETGFGVSGLQAGVFGGEVRIDGGTGAAAGPASAPGSGLSLSLRAQGVASAEGLQQAQELGAVAQWARFASGSTAYSAALKLDAGVPEIVLSSTLAGLALKLPAPLGKPAESVMPMRFELRPYLLASAGARSKPHDQLTMDLGPIGSIVYVRDLSGVEPRVLRGALASGLARDEAAELPAEGVVANLSLDRLDLDAWAAVLKLAPAGAPAFGASADAASRGAVAVAAAYLPSSVALRAGELVAAGRKLSQVVVGASREGLVWRANLSADQANGYVEYRPSTGAGAGRLYARLSRLTLATTTARDVETLLDDQPAAIPALDIVADELELRGNKLGRLELEAQNRVGTASESATREWRLAKFVVSSPDAVFSATGNWAAVNAQAALAPTGLGGRAEARRTALNFRLAIANSGELASRFGFQDTLRRGKGVMEGQVAWAGSPLTLDYPSMTGAFTVQVESGQFLKADPGLSKLLGVLSLQSLPRRLALDFRDVFSEGFAFDFLRGDVRIDQGMASSNNLQMKGVNAAVLMDGKADLARETQDIRVIVVPELNAGTASLIASAINPAVGLGSFLAQLFLRRPMMEAATQEFHVDGSWVDPRIRRVERGAGVTMEPRPGSTPDTPSGNSP